MSRVGEVAIGGMRLTAPAAWTFHEFKNLVLARSDARLGSLQISTAFRTDVALGASVTQCESIVREWLGGAVGPFRREPTGAMGFGSADVPASGGRAWYHLVDGQLLVAVFQHREPALSAAAEAECEEAERIVRSAAWLGGDAV